MRFLFQQFLKDQVLMTHVGYKRLHYDNCFKETMLFQKRYQLIEKLCVTGTVLFLEEGQLMVCILQIDSSVQKGTSLSFSFILKLLNKNSQKLVTYWRLQLKSLKLTSEIEQYCQYWKRFSQFLRKFLSFQLQGVLARCEFHQCEFHNQKYLEL